MNVAVDLHSHLGVMSLPFQSGASCAAVAHPQLIPNALPRFI